MNNPTTLDQVRQLFLEFDNLWYADVARELNIPINTAIEYCNYLIELGELEPIS